MNLPTVQRWTSWFSRVALIFGVSVCFAGLGPTAFAQRGASGHGGGHAGGHVGVAHGSAGYAASTRGGSSSHASSGSVNAAHFSSDRGVSAGSNTSRGYTRNTFVAGSSPRAADGVGAFQNESDSARAARYAFAADNYFWQAPPQQPRSAPAAAPRPIAPMQMPRPVTMPLQSPRPISSFTRPGFARPLLPGMVIRQPLPPTDFDRVPRPSASGPISSLPRSPGGSPFIGMPPVFPPGFSPRNPAFAFGFNPAFHHPIGGCFTAMNCGFGFGFPFFNPFFPQFGFGFGSPCFAGGFFNGCGFGMFGLDWGLGYGNGWFYPPAEEPPPPPVNPTEANPPVNFAPDYYFLPPPGEAVAAPAENKPVVKLELTDGTIFDVYAYWVQDNRLYYITTYSIQTSIPLSDLDLQKTVDLNAKLGTTFTLSNKPPDQQQDQQQPPDGSGQ